MHIVASRGALVPRAPSQHLASTSKAQTVRRAPSKAASSKRNDTMRSAASGDANVAVSAVAVETHAEPEARSGSSGRVGGDVRKDGPVVYIGDQVAHSLHERGREVFQVFVTALSSLAAQACMSAS